MQPFANQRSGAASDPLNISSDPGVRRHKRTSSGFAKRLWRALRRQALLIAGFIALALAIGAAAALWLGDWMLALAWAPIGVVLAVALATGREFSREAVYGMRAVERHSGSRVATGAPLVDQAALRGLSPDMRSPMWAAVFFPGSPFATALRGILSQIPQVAIVAVMGCRPGDGATTTASSLAAIASQQGKNVLLVDCDLRARGLSHMLPEQPQAGVLEAIDAPQSWKSLLQQEAETGLNILPAARLTNPWGHLFGKKGLEPLLSEWRTHFDLVILDCPPVLANAESAILARLADISILAVSWDDTSGAEIRSATRRLRQHRVTGLRMHMNRAPESILSQIKERG